MSVLYLIAYIRMIWESLWKKIIFLKMSFLLRSQLREDIIIKVMVNDKSKNILSFAVYLVTEL